MRFASVLKMSQSVSIKSFITLTLITLITVCAGAIFLAEAGMISYTHLAYITAENLLVVGAVLSIVFVSLTNRPQNQPASAVKTPQQFQLVAAGAAIFGGSLFTMLIAQQQGQLSPYDTLMGVLMGAALGLGVSRLAWIRSDEDIPPVMIQTRVVYIGLTVALIITCLLRWVAPASGLLTLVFAPFIVFIVPGLALTTPLLEPDAPFSHHLALAPILSITAQLIILAWLLWLGVAITPTAILLSIGVLTLIGALLRMVLFHVAQQPRHQESR